MDGNILETGRDAANNEQNTVRKKAALRYMSPAINVSKAPST